MFKQTLTILVAIITTSVCNSTWASTVTYTNRTSWLSAAGGSSDFLVDFNSYTTDTPITGAVDVGPFSVQSDSTNSLIDVPPYKNNDTTYGNGTPNLSLFVDGAQSQVATLTFDAPVYALFSDYWVPGNSGSPLMMQLSYATGGTADLTIGDYGTSSTSFGFVSDTSITKVTFYNAVNDGFNVDNIEGVSAVPVPAAAWLFGSGLIGLVGLAKRKRV